MVNYAVCSQLKHYGTLLVFVILTQDPAFSNKNSIKLVSYRKIWNQILHVGYWLEKEIDWGEDSQMPEEKATEIRY